MYSLSKVDLNPWDYQIDPFRIFGNLYYVGNKSVSSHLIETSDGLVLIDTAYYGTTYQLFHSITQLGFDIKDLKYIIHTHGHYDHFGGTKALVEYSLAKTFMAKEDIPDLSFEQQLNLPEEMSVCEIDTALSDGDTVKLGETEFKIVSSPGHTDGTISIFFNVSENGNEYTAGMHGGIGLNAFTEEYMEKRNITCQEKRKKQYLETLNKLEDYHVDIVLGNHPGQTSTFEKKEGSTEDKNLFVNKDEWGKFIIKRRDAFHKNVR